MDQSVTYDFRGTCVAPGQTKMTMFFCNICNAPKVLYRDEGSPRFRRLTIKMEVRTGAIVKTSAVLLRGRSQIQITALFAFLRYHSGILHTAYRKQFYPKPMVLMESQD